MYEICSSINEFSCGKEKDNTMTASQHATTYI